MADGNEYQGIPNPHLRRFGGILQVTLRCPNSRFRFFCRGNLGGKQSCSKKKKKKS